MKEGQAKWPIGLYAPGNYYCQCAKCGKQHVADKRAQHCIECTLQDYYARAETAKAALLTARRDALQQALEAVAEADSYELAAYGFSEIYARIKALMKQEASQ